MAACLSSGATSFSPAYGQAPQVRAYESATPCTSTSGPADNCYVEFPVTVVAFRWERYIKGHDKEFITVSSQDHGVAELVFEAGDPIPGLDIGMPGSVRIYRGQPVALDLGTRTLLTANNPIVFYGGSRQVGFVVLLLGVGLLAVLLLRLGVLDPTSSALWRRLTLPQWLLGIGIPLAVALFLTYRFFGS